MKMISLIILIFILLLPADIFGKKNKKSSVNIDSTASKTIITQLEKAEILKPDNKMRKKETIIISELSPIDMWFRWNNSERGHLFVWPFRFSTMTSFNDYPFRKSNGIFEAIEFYPVILVR